MDNSQLLEEDNAQRTTIDELFLELDLAKDIKILDAACGVGNIGKRLRSEGYNTVHGLDPIQGYLEAAGPIYSKTFKAFIDDKVPTSIEDQSYDVCICGAGFFHGLIPLEGIRELLRIVKEKGLVIWSIAASREGSVTKNAIIDDHYKIIQDMVANNLCEIVHRIKCEKLAFTDSGAAYLSGYVSSGIEALGIVYVIRKK